MEYSRIGYIARGQPPHIGHTHTVRKALEVADQVLILVGSAFQSPRCRHPFSFDERSIMWRKGFTPQENARIIIKPLGDTVYLMEKWNQRVQTAMSADLTSAQMLKPMAIIGLKKDHTTYYLDNFPQWDFVEVDNIDNLHSTDIRNVLFGGDVLEVGYILSAEYPNLPQGVKEYLKEYIKTDRYQWMRAEHKANNEYDPKEWDVAPITADTVVICSGHILVIERAQHPGKGLLALPGGYVNVKTERIHEAAERELVEETKIDIPPAILKSYYLDKDGRPRKDNHDYFDDVHRSDRNRIITHAWLMHLPPQKNVAMAIINEAIANELMSQDDLDNFVQILPLATQVKQEIRESDEEYREFDFQHLMKLKHESTNHDLAMYKRFMKYLKKSGTKPEEFSIKSSCLPAVKASDDAAKAFWMPLNEFALVETRMFEDHFHIATKMLSSL